MFWFSTFFDIGNATLTISVPSIVFYLHMLTSVRIVCCTGNGGALQRPAKDYTAINDSIRAGLLFDKEGPGLTDEEISRVEAEVVVDGEAAPDKTVL